MYRKTDDFSSLFLGSDLRLLCNDLLYVDFA